MAAFRFPAIGGAAARQISPAGGPAALDDAGGDGFDGGMDGFLLRGWDIPWQARVPARASRKAGCAKGGCLRM